MCDSVRVCVIVCVYGTDRCAGLLCSSYARRIQVFYRRWKAQQYYEELKVKASDILLNKKERRKGTINRNFVGDYIGYGDNPALRALVGKKERVEFAYTVNK